MATLSATKIVATYLGAAVESYESQQSMLPMVKVINDVDPATMQNGNNTIWREVVQEGASISGCDLTGQEQGIISQAYSSYLGSPENTFVGLRDAILTMLIVFTKIVFCDIMTGVNPPAPKRFRIVLVPWGNVQSCYSIRVFIFKSVF